MAAVDVLVAPDSFKGTATARTLAAAGVAAARRAGWGAGACPLSDGGEGFADVLEVLGGEERTASVVDARGRPLTAGWRLVGDLAVVETARAIGLVGSGGAEGNDPVGATSRGAGLLVAAAIDAGVRRVLVGLGGSATTDGGAGAVAALEEAGGTGSVEVVVACDVRTPFREAAAAFGPQKGATPTQVVELRGRLDALADHYLARYGLDVDALPGSGAAGGLAGGLAALGATLRPGFDVVAEAVGLDGWLVPLDLVVTGEGCLDASSWEGKVVGGVVALARSRNLPVLVVAGRFGPGGPRPGPGLGFVSLTDRFGADRSRADPAGCFAAVLAGDLPAP